ncbi:MAG: hypothetical protein JO356_03570 [Acidobacteria bacterium]|nr:hypothetical protein [Acidobacteriota bacterium]
MLKLTRNLEIAATLCGAILAGGGLDRTVVAMPAWRKLGSRAWAKYSRHADLGNGLIFYPAVALGGFAFSLAAFITYRHSRGVLPKASTPITLSVTLSALGLLLTRQAAPFMLSLRRIGDDPAGIERAFDGFGFWGGKRVLVQLGMLITNLWACMAISQDQASTDRVRPVLPGQTG